MAAVECTWWWSSTWVPVRHETMFGPPVADQSSRLRAGGNKTTRRIMEQPAAAVVVQVTIVEEEEEDNIECKSRIWPPSLFFFFFHYYRWFSSSPSHHPVSVMLPPTHWCADSSLHIEEEEKENLWTLSFNYNLQPQPSSIDPSLLSIVKWLLRVRTVDWPIN